MNKYLKALMSVFLLMAITGAYGAEATAYKIDCPEDFQDCGNYFGEKIDGKFIKKYPAPEWKIVVPLARFFLLGNGTLKGHFAIAVLPVSDGTTTKDLNSFGFKGKQPKIKFSIDKYWPDILAIGGEEFSDNKRFGPVADERVYKAKRIIYIKMAEEAAIAMIAECEKTDNCGLYEQ